MQDLPPLPWTWTTTSGDEGFEGSGHVYLVDSNGRKIASIWGKAAEKVALANFICAASDKGGSGSTEDPSNVQ